MSKRNKIIYWIATAWLALGMLSTGLVQVLGGEAEKEFMTGLGYPAYSLVILGIWKLFGVVAILIPRYPLLKEWAYAGFFFTMTGAVASHIISHDPVSEIFPSLLLLVLTIVSWYFRPAERKLILYRA
jgi:uncharacterized membrane protein YphA (DoxX/SURF4 family)